MSGVRIRGLEAVQAQLRSVGAEMGAKALGQAARAAFKRVAETAKALVPRDSGDLAEAITVRLVKPKSGDAVVVVGIAISSRTNRSKQATMAAAAFGEGQSKRLPPSRRWHFIELGTSKLAAHPYLRPALDSNANAVVSDLSEQLKKKIAAAIKKESRGK